VSHSIHTEKEHFCPGSPSSTPAAVQGPPLPSPGQHSEYSSVGFSHVGRGTGDGTTIQCFEVSRLEHVICI
jgi:hypothetical protein